MPMAEVSYIGLLRSNKAYRRLFTANEISYIGDWFSMIALFLLAVTALLPCFHAASQKLKKL